MPTNITQYVSVAARAAELRCNCPQSGMALLPINFESAKSIEELRHASQTATIKKLLLNEGLTLSDIVERKQRPPYLKNKSSDLILPILYVSASLYSQNPSLVNVALNVISNYVFETLRGTGLGREVKLDIVVEKESDRQYVRVSYAGPSEGLKTLPDSIHEALKLRKNNKGSLIISTRLSPTADSSCMARETSACRMRLAVGWRRRVCRLRRRRLWRSKINRNSRPMISWDALISQQR